LDPTASTQLSIEPDSETERTPRLILPQRRKARKAEVFILCELCAFA
jgi:hypothetical protein